MYLINHVFIMVSHSEIISSCYFAPGRGAKYCDE